MTYTEFAEKHNLRMSVMHQPGSELSDEGHAVMVCTLIIVQDDAEGKPLRSWQVNYTQGAGHIDWKGVRDHAAILHRHPDIEPVINAMARLNTPYDPVRICQAISLVLDHPTLKRYWSEPELEDVLQCIALDSQCYLDGVSFEDWAGEFGYDGDSRKAEALYKACMEQARRFVETFGLDMLQELVLECQEAE